MKRALRKERVYPVRPEVVWEALTNPAALAEWLMPNNFAPERGRKFEFRTDPHALCGSGLTRCEVLEIQPPRRMVWSWQRDASPGKPLPPPMTITWTLTPEGPGTRLTLEQTGLEHQGWLIGFLMNVGWGMMMRRSLTKVIARIDGPGPAVRFNPGAIPLKKRYYRCKTVPASYLHLTPAT